jgi:hypothetical protein
MTRDVLRKIIHDIRSALTKRGTAAKQKSKCKDKLLKLHK